jgi:Bacterial Ig-like domain (group 3)
MKHRAKLLFIFLLLTPGACEAQVVLQGDVTLRGNVTLGRVNIALTSSQSATAYATPVIFTAAMSSSMASGSITFYDGATALATVPIFSGTGTAQLTVSSLAVGTHSITAFYPTAGVTSAAVTQTVTGASSTLALTSSANPSAAGQSVRFTAWVMPSLCSGTVTFYSSGTSLGTGTLSDGSATYATSSLAAGSYTITATYSGDGNCGESTSPALSQTVSSTLTQTSVALASNPTTWYSGQQITFTATISPPPPNGETVTFYDGNTILPSPVATSGGTAVLMTNSLVTVGQHSITAHYPGDSALAAGTSNALTQAVHPYVTGLSLPQGPPQMGFIIRGSGFGDTASPLQLTDSTGQSVLLSIDNPITWADTSITAQVPTTATAGTSGFWVVKVTVNKAPYSSPPVAASAFSVVDPFGCQ